MSVDLLDAHQRHWEDAELLLTNAREANSDQLFGMSAECGLKRLMQYFGMPWDAAKEWPQDGDDRVHANRIWARFEAYRSGHMAGTEYALSNPNPFDDWDVSQRYMHRTHIGTAAVTKHRAGAEEVQNLVSKAQRDGLI